MKSSKKTKKRVTKKTKKKIGFTLIELLAVIIILGILFIVAIPSVTSYIADSRKNTYIITAREYINGTKNLVNNGRKDMFDLETTYYVPISCIETESGGESPYGTFKDAYVLVSYNGEGFDYYWVSTDSAKMGVYHTSEKTLSEEDIKTNVTNIDTSVAMGSDTKVSLVDPDTCEVGEKKTATSSLFAENDRITSGYTLEFENLNFNFNGKKSYVKRKNGTVSVQNLQDLYNNDFWHTITFAYAAFLSYNQSDFTEVAYLQIKIPKVKDASGNYVGVTSWYYEQSFGGLDIPDETWTCRGTPSQTVVDCTPKKKYVAKSYVPSNNINPWRSGYLYLNLDNGKYIRISSSNAAYGLYVISDTNYAFPSNYVYTPFKYGATYQ